MDCGDRERVNLIDRLDGLAAGITLIAGGTFFIYSFELSKGLALSEQIQLRRR